MEVFLRVEIIFLTVKEEDLVFIMLWILIIDAKKGVLQLIIERRVISDYYERGVRGYSQ